MAKNRSIIYLGYQDEPITDKNKSFVDYCCNKIGGIPNWPNEDQLLIPNCPICGETRPLILQIYAPLDNSQFHRTLYIFACLNAPCSNQNSGWICVRTQVIEQIVENEAATIVKPKQTNNKIVWCSGVDDWDQPASLPNQPMYVNTGSDNDDNDMNEANGNIIKYDNNNKISDDDESNSIENEIANEFENMQFDDKNANSGSCGGAHGGIVNLNNASAEIEEEEREVIVDLPIMEPRRDLLALLKQPQHISKEINDLTLKSYFIGVDEEREHIPYISDHIRDMLQDYQKQEDLKKSPDSPISGACGGLDNNQEHEKYEKSIPLHGDLIFHNFMSKIQENAGQILRYSRDSVPPLLIAPLKEKFPKCINCGSDVICELQILPTIISILRFENNEQAPIDFGNVLILTCSKSCWDTPDKMRLEMVLVQQEV
uniref:Programmed cell death protein 2 C-terminal domain-containing protein n=1 Tax=Corethrella appendiculata TaxID=1370023 RepID=U5EXL9_9DIPT